MSRKSQASGVVLPPLSTLVRPKKVAPAGREEQGEEADAGSRTLTAMARSLQAVEALLCRCISPGLMRWRALRPRGGPEDEEGEEPEGLARLAQVERSFLALSHCLCVQEDPHTETFQGRMRLEAAQGGPFSYHPARASVARHSAALHALLQQHHHLRLARHYSRRLKAASDFVRCLRAAERSLLSPSGEEEPGWGHRLRGLCEELRVHATHWEGLQRHMCSDPWLLPLLLQRHEVVSRMQQALSALALHASHLVEQCLEALLRRLAHLACLDPGSLSSFFQGLDIYNQVVKAQAWQRRPVALWADQGTGSDRQEAPMCGPSAFPTERVLGILAAERGQLVARRLLLLLCRLPAGTGSSEAVPWEGSAESWLPAGEALPSLSAELQALCRAEEECLRPVLGALVASDTSSLCQRILGGPEREEPLEPPPLSLPAWRAVRWLDASYSEAAGVLYWQYRPRFWSAAAASLAHQLELCLPLAQSQVGTLPIQGQQLHYALSHACVPQESTDALRGLSLRLQMRVVLLHWDRDFCRALGSSLTDKCVAATPSRATDATCSLTARVLRSLFAPLAFSWGSLPAWSQDGAAAGDDGPLVPAGCRLLLLSLSAAASQASCYWVLSKAQQHLASGSLGPFLLVTQGDLQLLRAEASRMAALVGTASPSGGRKLRPLTWQQEQELSRQVDSLAARMQHFAGDVPALFSSECRRLSAEVFSQTMPLHKHWRLALLPDVPPAPSEYAAAAAQAVLGQALQGVQPLPQEAREPVLSQATTAFLEAWMDHILAQKIKFSLQGALQLKQDFNLVREMLQSEESGLSAESRQRLLSLCVFQQVDGAIACLLQQPSKAALPLQTWEALQRCCSYNGVHMQESGPGSLHSLESLEGLPARAAEESQEGNLLNARGGGGGGGSRSLEDYLSPLPQEWLALRLHGGARRWKVPGLPCMCRTVEP